MGKVVSSGIPNIRVAYEALPDDPNRELLIETLLLLLQEARSGKIVSAAFVAFNVDEGFHMQTHLGVRDDDIPHACGLLDALKLDMLREWNDNLGHDLEIDSLE